MSTNPTDALTEALANVREGLVVRPGDTLVLHLPANMAPERIDQFRNQLEGICDTLPDGAKAHECRCKMRWGADCLG